MACNPKHELKVVERRISHNSVRKVIEVAPVAAPITNLLKPLHVF